MQTATFQRAPRPSHGYAPQEVTIEQISPSAGVMSGDTKQKGRFFYTLEVRFRFPNGNVSSGVGWINPNNDKQIRMLASDDGTYDTLTLPAPA